MRISVSVEYQLPMPRPPMSRVPTAFTSLTLPSFTPGIFGSRAGPGGVACAGGVSEGVAVVWVGAAVVGLGAAVVWVVAGGGLVCAVLCGLFCPYPVTAKLGASSKLLATANSAGISLLRSILLITEPLSRNRRRTTLQLLDLVCALLLAVGPDISTENQNCFTTPNAPWFVPGGDRPRPDRACAPKRSSPGE